MKFIFFRRRIQFFIICGFLAVLLCAIAVFLMPVLFIFKVGILLACAILMTIAVKRDIYNWTKNLNEKKS